MNQTMCPLTKVHQYYGALFRSNVIVIRNGQRAIVLDSWNNNQYDLYSNNTTNKLQALI